MERKEDDSNKGQMREDEEENTTTTPTTEREVGGGGGEGGSVEGFQKKIMPWDSAQFDEEISSYHTRRKSDRQQLIVVASLIDKTPNLAGLARTCEIFNASTLVLPSFKVLKEHAFQSISVTAEKWVPLEEVIHIFTLSLSHTLSRSLTLYLSFIRCRRRNSQII